MKDLVTLLESPEFRSLFWKAIGLIVIVAVILTLTGHGNLIPDTGYGPSSDNCYGRC